VRRVLILFPDEWDFLAARDPRHAGRYSFAFAGFDLFRFPQNLQLFTFDPLRFIARQVERGRREGFDGIVTSDEQFGPYLAAPTARELGLVHADPGAILTIQHKYYARVALQRIAPEANARFGLVRTPHDTPLAYPFYVKPAKAAFSVLARRIDSARDMERLTRFGWLEGMILRRLVSPFAQVMRAYSGFTEDPFSMVAEEILEGAQVTANGYVRDGKVTMLGTVDSVMYPGTDQFQRFEYPSSLPPDSLSRIDALAVRVIGGLALGNGMFNIEMRVDPASGMPRVIEINPRAAGQFYDLFERVDGYNMFDALLAVQCGEEPRITRGQGAQKHAASFVWRDLTGIGLSRWPSKRELAALAARHPEGHLMVYPKRGGEHAREMKWLGSYRYAVFNTGGATREEMLGHERRLDADIDFHPASRNR
jgi:hypothetical protein